MLKDKIKIKNKKCLRILFHNKEKIKSEHDNPIEHNNNKKLFKA
jgi:hypothetical protein